MARMSKEQKEERQRELKWQAEDDARILAQYQEIIQNKSRQNRAVREAKSQAKKMEQRANLMKKAAKPKK